MNDTLRVALQAEQALALVKGIASMTMDQECAVCNKDGNEDNPECEDHEPWTMDDDDAVSTVHSLIQRAREICRA